MTGDLAGWSQGHCAAVRVAGKFLLTTIANPSKCNAHEANEDSATAPAQADLWQHRAAVTGVIQPSMMRSSSAIFSWRNVHASSIVSTLTSLLLPVSCENTPPIAFMTLDAPTITTWPVIL